MTLRPMAMRATCGWTGTPNVSRVRCEPVRLPLRAPMVAAHGTTASRDSLLVVLETDNGEAGLGEASPLPSYAPGTLAETEAALQSLAAWAAGRSVATVWEEAEAQLPRDLPQGARGAALCAIETAAADILAQDALASLARWLAYQEDVALSARSICLPTQAVVDAVEPEGCGQAAAALAAGGFETLKLKLFGDVERDLERIAAVREAAPEAALRLDANGSLTIDRAVALLRRCARGEIALFEQPLAPGPEALTAHAMLAREVRTPIALDESCRTLADVDAIAEAGAADAIVVKPMVSGLREACRMVARARALGLRAIVTTTFNAAPGSAAAFAVAALLPEPRTACGLATASRLARDVARGLPAVEGGRITLSARPGLGLEVDGNAIEALRSGPGWSIPA